MNDLKDSVEDQIHHLKYAAQDVQYETTEHLWNRVGSAVYFFLSLPVTVAVAGSKLAFSKVKLTKTVSAPLCPRTGLYIIRHYNDFATRKVWSLTFGIEH